MRRHVHSTMLIVLVLLTGLSGSDVGQRQTSSSLQIESEARNPWTHLHFKDGAERFRFAIVGDRTGGHRGGVFALAVERLNWLQPDFVMSVGDLIEGEQANVMGQQWAEFQGLVGKLRMPFFYVPGNHDHGEFRTPVWKERFGRSYYHFVYKNVLFLVLNSNIDGEKGRLGVAQVAAMRQVLREHPGVRWTFLFLHHALWADPTVDNHDWLDLEAALAGRRYTVLCGHGHTHHKWVRQGANYYMMATTGAASALSGPRFGMMDHVTWVTMETEPTIANIVLDGVYPDDLCLPETVESTGSGYDPKTTAWPRVELRILLDGKPAAGKIVDIYEMKEGKPNAATKQFFGFVGADSIVIPWIERWPQRKFAVTVAAYQGQFKGRPVHLELERLHSKAIPAAYTDATTSGLSIAVSGGRDELNHFLLELRTPTPEKKP